MLNVTRVIPTTPSISPTEQEVVPRDLVLTLDNSLITSFEYAIIMV